MIYIACILGVIICIIMITLLLASLGIFDYEIPQSSLECKEGEDIINETKGEV